jgi:membrane protease YdiL (CAAX protease family)
MINDAKNYLDLARLGKNRWWRYLLSVAFILVTWFGFSLLVGTFLALWMVLDNNPNTNVGNLANPLAGLPPVMLALLTLVSILPLTVSLVIAVRFIHRRPILSLITPIARIDWKRLSQGFTFYLLLVGIVSFVEAWLFPGRYQFTFKPAEYFIQLPLFLILIPIQTTTEELLRGYMLQGFGVLARGAILPVLGSSLIFMLLHLANPEVGSNRWIVLAFYFVVGMLLAVVTIKDNRLELAIGAHAANNLFVLVANNAVSALPVPAIFTINTLDAGYNLAAILSLSLVFYAGFFVRLEH